MLDETPVFFDNDGQRLFGVLHNPQGTSLNTGFVFCHGFSEEKLWAHRVYVSMARDLAKKGYSVLRFDYCGYGDSEGEFQNCSVDTYLNDIQCAVSQLRNIKPGLSRIGLLGHRLGAALALHAYDYIGSDGLLILWDPIIDGNQYMQEFLRSHLSTQLAIYGEIRETREQLIERMNNGDLVNVEGYELNKEHYNSIASLNLNNIKVQKKSQILIVQTGRNVTPKKELQDLSNTVGAELRCVIEEPFWREIKRFYFEAENISGVTTEWLESCNA